MKRCIHCKAEVVGDGETCGLCPTYGPGTELKNLIPFKASPSCGCAEIELLMNRIGPIFCKQRRLEIAAMVKPPKYLRVIPYRIRIWKLLQLIDQAIANTDRERLFEVPRCQICLAVKYYCPCDKEVKLKRPRLLSG